MGRTLEKRDAVGLHACGRCTCRQAKKKEGQTIEAAVVETLKYATKVQDSLKSPEWLYIVTEQLHKMRFVESGGVLKGVLKEIH